MAERREREYGKTKISKSFELLVEERGGGRNLELKWGGGEEEREREREREREYKREQEREREGIQERAREREGERDREREGNLVLHHALDVINNIARVVRRHVSRPASSNSVAAVDEYLKEFLHSQAHRQYIHEISQIQELKIMHRISRFWWG